MRFHPATTDRSILAATLLLLAGMTGCWPGREPESIDLEVTAAFAAEPATGERTALYFTVTNRGSDDDELIAVSTEVAAIAEIHTTVRDGEMMRMEEMDALLVHAGEVFRLAPSGIHIMLLDLQETLRPGDRINVTLSFRHAGDMLVRAEVVPYAELEEALAEANDPAGTR